MEKKFLGNRRVYTAKKKGLEVVIEITTNTNPQLAKLLDYDQKAEYMFADTFLTDKTGLCLSHLPENQDAILQVTGLRDAGGRFCFVELCPFVNESMVDKYAERILEAV